MTMSQRLRMARILAGYKTASEAIQAFAWMSSAYRAHENGQNKFSTVTAKKYARAYNTTAAWLMLGQTGEHARTLSRNPSIYIPNKKNNNWTVEKIYALAVIFRDDQRNLDVLRELINYAQTFEKMSHSPHVKAITLQNDVRQ